MSRVGDINWCATGNKENKREFLHLLIENGVRSFDGRKTARHIIEEGSVIKGVKFNRKGKNGEFFISSHNVDTKLTHFNLDHYPIPWAVRFILDQA